MYIHKEIEEKWQNHWEKNKTFKTDNDFSKPKYYCLDMFPFPSWAWLHVGHPEWMTANDIVARYKHSKGFNVLHPMWWDAFWLPAENYAIKTGTHPSITTKDNIDNFRKQIKSLGFSYDWDREVDTTDPKYYKWTQWIFLKLFEKWLAYEQDLPINYCPSCKTWLANEEVLNDFTCERCHTKVEKKQIRQWVLAITKYADRLEKDVDKLDWPEWIKDMQKNWIGKSKGCEFEMKKSDDKSKSISVYTTRIDTVFGMTYAVLAPDHHHVSEFISPKQKDSCLKYIDNANKKSDQDRTQDDKEKTWVFTWSYVINPFNLKEVPLWIWDYVLWNYWTGAVMAVPAHDIRDFAFAKKYELEVIESISGWEITKKAFTNLWVLINSGEFSELKSKEAQTKMIDFAEKNNFWTKKINYKLRDWLFSRQRYWWEPIPLIHLDKNEIRWLERISSLNDDMKKDTAYVLKEEKCEASDSRTICSKWKVKSLVVNWKVVSKIYEWIYSDIICDYELPLKLPEVEEYAPSGDGQSPLAKVDSFIHIKLADNLDWKRETNTMPQWWGSCWYYLRYMDNENSEELVNREIANYWWEVDSYVGWAEHAVLHLLYARFWHKFLYDIWIVPTDEPFHRLRNQWLILAHAFQDKNGKLIANDLIEEKDWEIVETETWEKLEKVVAKMSKSLKNVVNPDDIVDEYWADSLRLYEMYLSDFKDAAPWDTTGIIWVRRFLEKSERLFWAEAKISTESDENTMKLVHKTIKKIEEDIENYKFNTAIASLMILVNNGLPKDSKLVKEWKNIFARLLHPFAPHLAEELWERIWEEKSVFFSTWPEYDEKMTIDDTIKIAVQVLGKLRWTIEINKDENKDTVLDKAKSNIDVVKWLEWKEIVKEIYVPWKIVNLVVK